MQTIDIVEREAEVPLLRPHLLGETDIAEAAVFVHRGACRNSVRAPALRLDVLQRILPALANADIEAFIDQANVRAHDAAELNVADAVINRILVRDPGLLDETALHADLGGDRRDHAGVIRLHAADRDQCVGVRGDRVGDDVFELAQLVAAEREAGVAVFALGVELDVAAEMRGEARQLLDMGGPKVSG